MAKKNFDYCEDVSTLKQHCSKKKTMSPTRGKKSEPERRKKKHPYHLLFIAIQFYKSGSLLWFSEERKYSY